MVPGYVAHPGQLEAAPPPLEVDGPIPGNNNKHITKLCTSVFRKLLLLCYIVWSVCLLVMQPKTPKFKVESGTVQLNPEGSQLTAQWDITLLATNPNHNFKIYYKHIQAGILYQTGDLLYTLVKTPWPSFVSNKRNQTRVEFKFSVWKEQLSYEVVEEIFSHEVGLSAVRFISSMWFMSKLLPPEHAELMVTCKVPNNGTFTLTSQYSGKCVVEYYKTYILECLVISSFIFLAIWACIWCICICDSKPRNTSARIAPS